MELPHGGVRDHVHGFAQPSLFQPLTQAGQRTPAEVDVVVAVGGLYGQHALCLGLCLCLRIHGLLRCTLLLPRMPQTDHALRRFVHRQSGGIQLRWHSSIGALTMLQQTFDLRSSVSHLQQRTVTSVCQTPQHFLYGTVQADNKATGLHAAAVCLRDERAPAGGDDQVASLAQLLAQLGLQVTKDCFPLPGEDGGNGLARSLSDDIVHVHKLPPQPPRNFASYLGLARAHEAGEDHVGVKRET